MAVAVGGMGVAEGMTVGVAVLGAGVAGEVQAASKSTKISRLNLCGRTNRLIKMTPFYSTSLSEGSLFASANVSCIRSSRRVSNSA